MCGSSQSKITNASKNTYKADTTASKASSNITPLSTPKNGPVINKQFGNIEKGHSLSKLEKNVSVPQLRAEAEDKKNTREEKLRQASRIHAGPRRRGSDEFGEGTGVIYEIFKNQMGPFPFNQSELSAESKSRTHQVLQLTFRYPRIESQMACGS